MIFTVFALPSLLAFLSSIVLGAYVLRRAPKNPANRAFAVWMAFFAVWTFGELMNRFNLDSPEGVAFWSRVAYGGSFFIAPSFAHFVFRLLGKRTGAFLLYVPFLPFVLTLHTSLIVKGARLFWWGYGPENGALYSVFSVMFILLLSYAWYLLWQARKAVKSPLTRKKLNIMLYTAGTAIAVGGFTNAVLPSLGIYLFPLASTFAAITAMGVGYAFMLRWQKTCPCKGF